MMYDIKEALQETTGLVQYGSKEDSSFEYPPHTYYITYTGKMCGYKSAFTGEYKWFTKPLSFNKSRRRFKKVEIPEII